MKYILIIVICFMGLATKAQVQKQGRSNFPTVVDSSLAIGKNFILPVFRSFSQLATYTNLDSSGRLVFIRDSNAVFYRTNAHTWAKLSSGSISSVAWGNITGDINNQTDLINLTNSKVDYVFTVGGDSLYNHYSTGEVQFIGIFSTNAPNLADGLIFVQNITLSDTTVTIVPDIVWRRSNVNDTQSIASVFEINKADSGYSRFDLIYIDSLNVIRLIEGVQDTGIAIPPSMPPHGIQITIVSIVGDVVLTPTPSVSTNYWSPNGNNISSGTAYLGTLNSKTLDFIIAGLIRASLDTIGQMRFPLVNNGNYPHALTFYNNLDATLPSFNLAVNSSYGEISLSANNTGYLNALRIKKSNGIDSIVGGAYSDMILQDYGKLKYNSTSSQQAVLEIANGNNPLFTVNSLNRNGAYFGSDTTYKPSSALTVSSTTQGMLVPRMTTTQMNAIGTPSNGLLIYNLTDTAFYWYKLDTWTKLGASSGGGSTGDTLFVRTPLKVNSTNDTLYMNQVSDVDSGWVSPDQKAYWDAGGNSWGLEGNAGTDPTVNFLGTTDAQPLYLRVNNDTVAKFGIDKNVSIGGSAATGYLSFSTGVGQAIGEASVAMNANTIAFGGNSVALGAATTATGESSLATGRYTVSNGISSIAGGVFSNANGNNSASFGQYVTAKSRNSFVIGRNNDTTAQANDDTTVLFRIGNGYATVGDVNGIPSNILTTTYTGLLIGNHTSETNLATLHVKGTDTFALMVTGMGNSVVGTDSAVVRDINGNFKVAAKSSGGGVSTAQLTDSLNARGATYLQVNNPSATGSFTLTSTTGGITNARVTTTQMNAISSPVAGTQVYNTDYASLMEYSTEWGWTSDNTDWKIRNMIDYSNDFTGPLGNAIAYLSDGMLTTSVANGGLIDTGQAVTVNRIGLVKLSTGTNASGQARIATGTGAILQTMILGGGRIVLETAVYTNILPSAAERYSDILGFSATNNNVSISNGVLFVYDSSGVVAGSTASPNWQVCTDSANTRTFSNTGVAVTANTWYNLKIIVNAAGTSVDFYINDALVKTETRTIPILPVGIMLQRYKGGGTTARNLYVDYIRYKQKFTTSR